MAREYVIKAGDTFYKLGQKLGGTGEEWMKANPGINPGALQIGQKLNYPTSVKSGDGSLNAYAHSGQSGSDKFCGESMDEISMEIEGLKFSIRRVGEMKVPHELHLILPRTEIRKVQPVAGGPCEVQIMLSNINLVHSPRLMSGEGGPLTQAVEITPAEERYEQRQ